MLDWLRKFWTGSPAKAAGGDPRGERISARYDAAVTTGENRRHWVNADNLAADAAASPEVRATLRNRGRYEHFNNPYMDGALQTLAADQVGKCPVLQSLTDDEGLDAVVDFEFRRWADEINLGEKLRIAVETEASNGEVFIRLGFNPLIAHAVKLDLTLIEADQVTSADLWGYARPDDPRHTDGIEYDRWNNPTFYHVLREHPGDTRFFRTRPNYFERVPAAEMIHLYRPRRPGQRRGIPRITSSLPLFADRRGFRVSVLSAARKAAELGAIVLETDYTPESLAVPAVDVPFEELDIAAGQMTTLPLGSKAKQLAPTQPGTTYKEFDDKLINESTRPINMPFNIAACNSSGYNYSSGQLDHQTYDRANEIDQSSLELKILRRVLVRFVAEALRLPGYWPFRAARKLAGVPPHAWLFREREHSDPTKGADAARIRMETNQTSLGEELARKGKDFDTHIRRLERERKKMLAAGLIPLEPKIANPPPAPPAEPADGPPGDEADGEDGDDLRADRARRNGAGALAGAGNGNGGHS